MRWLVGCLALALLACSADTKSRSQNGGPNYSAIPCSDNCGADRSARRGASR
ncbi:MAG: hypothetical protein JOZ69_09665 [Myxococcales bacterium]|nr:hypothetical protein [Myxococcales bacterium]